MVVLKQHGQQILYNMVSFDVVFTIFNVGKVTKVLTGPDESIQDSSCFLACCEHENCVRSTMGFAVLPL